MPIYEFYCPDNNRIYSFFARSVSMGSRVPRCPDNPKFAMRRVMSGFAVTRGAGERDAAGAEGADALDDPRMEAALAQMEKEFASLDENNPDPRRMGELMRRMSSLTGERLPEPMEEMIRRMEAGEDLEKLEEEYGDSLDDPDAFGGMGDDGMGGAGDGAGAEAGGGAPSAGKLAARLRRATRKPTRDPVLYEMSDYLDADS